MTTATERRVPADTLPARLILVRAETGWSQREAAEMCGITYGEWQSMENGRDARGLPAKLKKISAVTGYDLDWLLWGGPLGAPSSGDDDTPNGVRRPRGESNSRPTAYNSGDRAVVRSLVSA